MSVRCVWRQLWANVSRKNFIKQHVRVVYLSLVYEFATHQWKEKSVALISTSTVCFSSCLLQYKLYWIKRKMLGFCIKCWGCTTFVNWFTQWSILTICYYFLFDCFFYYYQMFVSRPFYKKKSRKNIKGILCRQHGINWENTNYIQHACLALFLGCTSGNYVVSK